MSEIAMLSHFVDHAAQLPPALRDRVLEDYRKIHSEYVDFLSSNVQGDIYFKNDKTRYATVLNTLRISRLI